MEAGFRKKRPPPDWYEDEPDLLPGDEFYLNAFWDLSTTRSFGFGAGPIPWDKIVAYASIAGIEHDGIEPFVRIIRKMDEAFLDWDKKQSGQAGRT